MFSLNRPADESIDRSLVAARALPVSYGFSGWTENALGSAPRGYALDHTRSQIGRGVESFETAKAALRAWRHFDLGWVRVANPEVPIRVGEVVAVEAHALGLWSVNLSRILYVIDEPERFGFGYGTTAMHVERGEERFLIEHFPATDLVFYDLLAVSQPAHWMARLGYPYTRSRQKRFALESHRRMARVADVAPRIGDRYGESR